MSGSSDKPPGGQDPLQDAAQRKALARALALLLFEREQDEARQEERRKVDR